MGFENHFAALRCEETNCRRHGYARYEAISGDCVGAFHGDDGVRLWLRHERATAPSPATGLGLRFTHFCQHSGERHTAVYGHSSE